MLLIGAKAMQYIFDSDHCCPEWPRAA